MKKIDENVSAGSGNVAGLGVGNNGEPGQKSSNIVRRSMFAGKQVFEVAPDFYHKSMNGKLRYHRYDKYVGDDETGLAIKEFGKSNPSAPIILKNEKTGALQYLKYGK